MDTFHAGGLATLLVNPAAGRARRLNAVLPGVRARLAARGMESETLYTTGEAGSERVLAAKAARRSALVIACGGDGTVHGVVQGLAHTGVALGVLPLGTANALARNLGLPLEPLAALDRLLGFAPRKIALGEVETARETRLFTVLAGCGPDGALMQTLSAAGKSTLGRSAYYAQALRLFVTRRWPVFRVEYRLAGSPAWQMTEATGVMASRVPDLGGMFSGLTPRARLEHPHLHVHLLRAPARMAFPAWFTLGRVGVQTPYMTQVDAEELRCTAAGAEPVYVQADGEALGTLPMTLRIVPDALTLLMPGLK